MKNGMGFRMKVIRYTSPEMHFIPNNNKRNFHCNQINTCALTAIANHPVMSERKTAHTDTCVFTGGRHTPGWMAMGRLPGLDRLFMTSH